MNNLEVFSETKKGGEFPQHCGLSWNGSCPVLGRRRREFSRETLLSKVAVKLNVSCCPLDSHSFLLQLVGSLVHLLLVLGGRVISGAGYRTKEFVENPFLDPCIEESPSKDVIAMPAVMEHIWSQSEPLFLRLIQWRAGLSLSALVKGG